MHRLFRRLALGKFSVSPSHPWLKQFVSGLHALSGVCRHLFESPQNKCALDCFNRKVREMMKSRALAGSECAHTVVWAWYISFMLTCLNHLVPSWGHCLRKLRNFQEVQLCWRKYVTGGRLWGSVASPYFLFFLVASCVQLKCDLSASNCQSGLNFLPPWLSITMDSIPLELWLKINSFPSKLLVVIALYHHNKKLTV